MRPGSPDANDALRCPTCPVCGTGISERPFLCPHCDTPHHADCWDYNGGCATYGCTGVPGGRRPRGVVTSSGDRVAGTGARMVAFFIDWFLFIIAQGFLLAGTHVLFGVGAAGMTAHVLSSLGLAGLWLFRDTLANGRSPGKALLNLRIDQPDETSTNFRNSVLRNLPLAAIYLFNALAFVPGIRGVMGLASAICSLVWFTEVALVVGSSDGRRLGDRLAGTTLVKEARRLPMASPDEIRFLEGDTPAAGGDDDDDEEITIVSSTTARDRWDDEP